MTTHAIQNLKYPIAQSQRMQDVLLVSSFGLWAALLGFGPVLAWRLLMAA